MNKPTFEEYLKFSLEELKAIMDDEVKATDKIDNSTFDMLDIFDLSWEIEEKYYCEINDVLVGEIEDYIGKTVQELIQSLYDSSEFKEH